MLKRVALVVRVSPAPDAPEDTLLHLANADTSHAVAVGQHSFLLTLECEPDVTYSRGQLRSLRDGTTYPIQSNLALYEALAGYVARAEGSA